MTHGIIRKVFEVLFVLVIGVHNILPHSFSVVHSVIPFIRLNTVNSCLLSPLNVYLCISHLTAESAHYVHLLGFWLH